MGRKKLLISLVGLALAVETWAVAPKISLDFDNVEAAVVLARISQLWGRVLTVDSAVHGRVTVHLHEVAPEEAVRQVLAQLSPRYRFQVKEMRVVALVRQEILLDKAPAAKVIGFLAGQYKDVEFIPHPTMNGFYAVGCRADVLSIKNDVPNLDLVPDVPPPTTREFVQVKYGDLNEVKSLLATLVPDVQISVNSNQSTLVLQGSPGAVEQAQELLDCLGAPASAVPKQVTTGHPAAGACNVTFQTESYKSVPENVFQKVSQQPLSTFAADVDTGSYSNVRRMLMAGLRPPADAVRIEEMINYFSYDYAPPGEDEPVSVTTRLARCPWDGSHSLLQVGLRTATPVSESQRPRNLVFLVDVSGSMSDPDKLPLVQKSLDCLVQQLNERDHIAMVVYAGSSGLVLPPTGGDRKELIRQAIRQLEAGGSTNGAAGIQQAYQVAREHFDSEGVNRVILCTDGDFNVGVSSEGELVKLIERERQSGVFLSVLGFGQGNLKDDRMEQLADHGNGNYAYIDSLAEARKVLVSQAGATLVTVAKDVKIQVEFNPAQVAGYRLLGYENRALQAQDFNNDRKDAGEMGQGHSVTALYELVPAGQPVPGGSVDPLRYQQEPVVSGSSEVAHVKIRYKPLHSEVSQLIERAVASPVELADPQGDLAFASAVAAFGMVLRESPSKGSATYGDIRRWAGSSLGADEEGYRAQFLELVDKAERL